MWAARFIIEYTVWVNEWSMSGMKGDCELAGRRASSAKTINSKPKLNPNPYIRCVIDSGEGKVAAGVEADAEFLVEGVAAGHQDVEEFVRGPKDTDFPAALKEDEAVVGAFQLVEVKSAFARL